MFINTKALRKGIIIGNIMEKTGKDPTYSPSFFSDKSIKASRGKLMAFPIKVKCYFSLCDLTKSWKLLVEPFFNCSIVIVSPRRLRELNSVLSLWKFIVGSLFYFQRKGIKDFQRHSILPYIKAVLSSEVYRTSYKIVFSNKFWILTKWFWDEKEQESDHQNEATAIVARLWLGDHFSCS